MNDHALNNPYLPPDAVLTGAPVDNETYQPSIFSLQGRIGRLRYLAYSFLLGLLLSAITGILAAITVPAVTTAGSAFTSLIWLLNIPVIGVGLVLAKRRLNDLDRTGWLAPLILVPFLNILFILYLIFGPGSPAANRFGPRPVKNSVLLVVGGLLLPIVFVVGILAAVAIPAYQDYVMRAKAAQVR